jgi:transcriptional regulator with XRE-family HTH domain
MTMNISGDNVRRLRFERGWTQEHLASLTGRSVRTIQRVEKTGICDLETRSALAAVFQIDVAQLDGDKKIEQVRQEEEREPLYYSRLRSGREIVDVFDGTHMYRFSNESPRCEDDTEYMSWVVSQIHDYFEIWDDIEPGSRVKATYEFGVMLREMEEKGLRLFGVRTKRRDLLPASDGTAKAFDARVANFHIAYAGSAKIFVLDPRD